MQSNLKRRIFTKYLPSFKPLLIVGFLFLVGFYTVKIITPYYQFAKENKLDAPFFYNLMTNENTILKSFQGRTNIVLLGVSGGIHDGADLTDSIMFVSADFIQKNAVMISIPRDVWLPTLKDRINTAYHYGEKNKKESGFILSKAAVEEVLGAPVHYAFLIDFSGFQKLIDFVGGVDVNVEQAFEDTLYPIPGKENDLCEGDPEYKCRYEHLKFEKGMQHMDGVQSLKFVRSRQAEGEEGTDFARGKRQQKVIIALKNKIVTPAFLKDPQKIRQLIALGDEFTTTDMKWAEIIAFGKFYNEIPSDNVRHLILDTGDKEKGKKGLLINPPEWQYEGAWVLTPRTDTFDEIHTFVKCYLESQSCDMKP